MGTQEGLGVEIWNHLIHGSVRCQICREQQLAGAVTAVGAAVAEVAVGAEVEVGAAGAAVATW